MKKIFSLIVASFALASCADLDVPSNNIVTSEQLLSDQSGIDIYMARLYSRMPYEDFKYNGKWGYTYNSWLVSIGVEGTGECLDRDDICRAFVGEDTPYWGMAFEQLREINYLLETLPQYSGNYPEDIYNHYIGEAYYIRAMVFTAMAKRFGGVPLVTKVVQYPAEVSELEVPRASEEETWDQVLADFDAAIEHLLPISPKVGYANKYKALAWKSEAMLYAGSVAKYNQTVNGNLTGIGQKTGVRVMGFAPDSWEAASKKYFTEAYKAAKEVVKSNKYELYTKKFAENDAQAQYENLVEMFFDNSSPENIDVKEYLSPTTAHSLEAFNAPFVYHSPLSCGMCPTADFCQLFDGFDRYDDGSIRVTDGTSNDNGNYLLFDDPMDFYANVEPRLRAWVIYPGDFYRDRNQEVRTGTYVGATPIEPLFKNYGYETKDETYQQLEAYTKKPKTLYLSPRQESSQEIVSLGTDEDGKELTMTASGANGPFYDNAESCLTGLMTRKYMSYDLSQEIGEGKSYQNFILMRYAEVLLNLAESAVELSLSGVASPDGDDLMAQATEAINKIRHRAGAPELTVTLSNNVEGRDIVRRERRKELAFEHKTKWDLRRWRVQHYEGRDGFWGENRNKNTYSNNEKYCFSGIYPFYSTQAKKWFFDIHFQFISQKVFSYSALDYYWAIPGNEVVKSSYIDQQPNR